MNVSKSSINAGVAAYLLQLDHEGKTALSKEEKREIREAVLNGLNMLLSLREPVDPFILDNALANLLAYIVSNGAKTRTEKKERLSCVMIKAQVILAMVEQPPLAEVLDYIHGKKNHPLTRIIK